MRKLILPAGYRMVFLPTILTLLFIGFSTNHANADTKNNSLDSSPSNSFIVTPTDSPKNTFVENNSKASDNVLSESTISNSGEQKLLVDGCDCAKQPLKSDNNPSPLGIPVQSDSQSSLIRGLESAGSFGNHNTFYLNPNLIPLVNLLSYYLLFAICYLLFLRPYLRFHTSLSPPQVFV